MLVRDVMSSSPLTASEDASLLDVARRMRDADVGAIPIVDKSERLVGVLTDRDIVLRGIAEGRNPERTHVRDILTRSIVTVDANATLEKATELMRRHQVRRLPVIDQARLVGMISLADIAIRHPEKPAVADVLESISGRHRRSARKRASARGE
jgi:CBS domain-containing protein